MNSANSPHLPQQFSTSRKFARNALFNVAGFVITLPILILLTPYMLEVLGKAGFGVWALAGVITSYAQLSNMGMTTAIVKFVAESQASKRVDEINKIVSTAFFSLVVAGGIVAGGLLLARNFIVADVLKVPQAMQDEAIFVVTGVVVIFYFNLLFGIYNAILLGLQRMDVTNAIIATSKILRALGMWGFLAFGLGLKGLIINGAIFSVLVASANIIAAKYFLKRLKVSPRQFSFSTLNKILIYSLNIFFARLVELFNIPANKIILSAFTSLVFVSFYEIGCRIRITITSLFTVALTPLLPASSELQSSANQKELEDIYFTISRGLYLYAIPVLVLIIVMAKPLIFVWLGDGYELAAYSIQFLLTASIFSTLLTPQYVILQGTGRPQINTAAHLIAGVGNLLISVPLTIKIGFSGVLVGLAVSEIVANIYLFISFHSAMGIKWKSYLENIPVVAVIAFLLLGFLLGYSLTFVTYWNLAILVLYGLFYIFSYALVLKLGNLLDSRDKVLIYKVIEIMKLGQLWNCKGIN